MSLNETNELYDTYNSPAKAALNPEASELKGPQALKRSVDELQAKKDEYKPFMQRIYQQNQASLERLRKLNNELSNLVSNFMAGGLPTEPKNDGAQEHKISSPAQEISESAESLELEINRYAAIVKEITKIF